MAWELLLKSDFGLLSLAVIVFIILMGIFLPYYFMKQIKAEDEGKEEKRK